MGKQFKILTIDTNGKTVGKRQVTITEGAIIHDHSTEGITEYFATGKIGTNFKTGAPISEYASASDERIWLADNWTTIWED